MLSQKKKRGSAIISGQVQVGEFVDVLNLGPYYLILTGFRVESEKEKRISDHFWASAGWGIYGCAKSGARLINFDWFSC